ncbi:MAG: hypothetical protein A2373_03780 [Candidatus Magasanikbacteria bacterium RIFOXYB1_FULL_40_15]|uniref:Uncharacterized protein n=1 Tax=Candidatus Magasanikbacteria bacterium RIFOXYB1_FULL_40_15 TaxID=1798697 RepID=A0A1F6NFI6_9BACT|nr:MAG: hypothetical protein A2373_03780 [Candidatus Magasanikbacteria bacterium RIFOXYB1_FULL_40_15]
MSENLLIFKMFVLIHYHLNGDKSTPHLSENICYLPKYKDGVVPIAFNRGSSTTVGTSRLYFCFVFSHCQKGEGQPHIIIHETHNMKHKIVGY